MLVLTRRLEGPTRRLLPVVAGTVFSQTLINLLALAILAAVTFTSVPLLHGHVGGGSRRARRAAARSRCSCSLGPRLLALGAALALGARGARGARGRARCCAWPAGAWSCSRAPATGSAAVARPAAAPGRCSGWPATGVLALGLQSQASLVGAAAILLAVNVSAILPATPSNVGVFQAACLVVLAAYGVGAGPGLAYGIILQAVEVVTALALGVPALLGEGLTWRRHPARAARSQPGGDDEPQPASARSDWRSERVVCSTAVGS